MHLLDATRATNKPLRASQLAPKAHADNRQTVGDTHTSKVTCEKWHRRGCDLRRKGKHHITMPLSEAKRDTNKHVGGLKDHSRSLRNKTNKTHQPRPHSQPIPTDPQRNTTAPPAHVRTRSQSTITQSPSLSGATGLGPRLRRGFRISLYA